MLEALTLATCTDAVNTVFRAYSDPDHVVELRLLKATAGRCTERQEQFSLEFGGPLETFLPQHTYPVEHDKLGRLELFLVPVAQERDGFRYQAVFNRLI